MLDYAFIVLCFSSGLVIAGAVYAFITIIGIIPRLVTKTKTKDKIMLYENVIILGGMFGTIATFMDFRVPMGNILIIVFGFCLGIFTGTLAISLAETLDVLPVLNRRIKLRKGLNYIIFAIAFGKFFGSLVYFTNEMLWGLAS